MSERVTLVVGSLRPEPDLDRLRAALEKFGPRDPVRVDRMLRVLVEEGSNVCVSVSEEDRVRAVAAFSLAGATSVVERHPATFPVTYLGDESGDPEPWQVFLSFGRLSPFPERASDRFVEEVLRPGIEAGAFEGLLDSMPEARPGGRVDWLVARGGFAALTSNSGGVGRLERCWVHPRMRGLGIGHALYHGRVGLAHMLALRELMVTVRTEQMRDLFLSRGWRSTSGRHAGPDGKYHLTHQLVRQP